MHILVSNDDGYTAPGLEALVASLRNLAEVTVVAPEINHSGASNSLTLTRPLAVRHAANGFIYVNGTPVLWGSSQQTSIADSSCAAEFVGASVCAKQMTHVENMCQFLGFTCPKPYPVYTDSQASLAIASNSIKLGNVRHIAIRYHLVRAMVASGDIKLIFCVTEDMVADLLTKILVGAVYDHLAARFYFLGLTYSI